MVYPFSNLGKGLSGMNRRHSSLSWPRALILSGARLAHIRHFVLTLLAFCYKLGHFKLLLQLMTLGDYQSLRT